MNNRPEKPKIPQGRRKLEAGEMIQPGHLKWDINKKKWVEIAGAINKPVLQSQDGFLGASIFGAMLIRKGISAYQSWREWMALKYGESVRENLGDIYSKAEAKATEVDAMEQESRELLGPSVWRPLEDAAWSSEAVREAAMLSIRIAYNDLSAWNPKRLKFAVEVIAILTVSRILAELSPLPEEIRNQCRNVNTTAQALQVTQEAGSAILADMKADGVNRLAFDAVEQISWAAADAGWGAIRAAWTLTELASAAAKAADAEIKWGADPDEVLRKACEIWVEVAEATNT